MTITGVNDAAVIAGVDTAFFVEDEAPVINAAGSLTISDIDTDEALFVAETINGVYGSLSIDTTGNWTYSANNAELAIQALRDGEVAHDIITVRAIDGTTHDIDLQFTGVNDLAVISGDNIGAVTEDQSTSTISDSGKLDVTDVDTGEANFVTGTLAGLYGSLTIDADGNWIYAADNTQLAIQSLGAGLTLTDTITVSSIEGTTQDVTVTITGVNDAAVIAGVDTAFFVEDEAPVINAAGSLTISDVDTDEALFVAETINGVYGSLSIDTAGNWTYSANNTELAIQALRDGEVAHDIITVRAIDGTTHDIDLQFTGANDLAVISGDNIGAVTEDQSTSTISDSGKLDVTDVDTGEANFVTGTLAGLYGSLTIDADGNWIYAADNTQLAIQSLGAGLTLTDTITVSSIEGTTQDVTVTITGVNDLAVISGDNIGAVTEDQSTSTISDSGKLDVTDVDTGEANFVTGTLAGLYGSLTIDADGNWIYAADNTQLAIQSLGAGLTLTDTITVSSIEGTTQDVTVTITGVNDAAVIGGVDTAFFVEDEAPVINAAGSLTISDVDTDEALFVAETINGVYGSLSIDTTGNWTYSANNTELAIQALRDGEVAHDIITVTAIDGTTHDIDLQFTGANDLAVISGDNIGAVTEDQSTSTISDSGKLDVTDVDTGEANFVTGTLAGLYGSLTIDADGNWIYAADNTQLAIQSLGAGLTLTDTITVSSIEGTTQDVTVTITGVNDAAVIGGDFDGLVVKDGSTSAQVDAGNLTISDVDLNETEFVTGRTIGAYGELTILSTGIWVYVLDQSNATVASLQAGQSLTDTITISAVDGTTQDISVSIGGGNEAPVATPNTGNVAEDGNLIAAGNVIADDDGSGIDSDPEGDTLSISKVGTTNIPGAGSTNIIGQYGTLTMAASGDYSYTLDNNNGFVQGLASGATLFETFTYTLTDGLAPASSTLVISIQGDDDLPQTLNGDALANTLHGRDSDDLIDSLDGDDVIYGHAGNDGLNGGAGSDTIYGGSGLDFIYGETGVDYLYGGDDTDAIFAGDDNDEVWGGNGGDNLDGGYGDDILHGENGIDWIYGSFGNDTLYGGADGDALFGQEGQDTLFGGDGGDSLDGGTGDDFLNGESGVDWIFGGAGNDELHGGMDTDALFGEDGFDTIHGGDGGDSLDGGSDSDMLFGEAGVDWLFGGSGDDLLDGGNDSDVLFGNDGNDMLQGGAFGDSLDGGAGDDVLDGGDGIDVLYGDVGADIFFVFNAAQGGDVVRDFFTGEDKLYIDPLGFGVDPGTYSGQITSGMFSSGSGLPATLGAGPQFYLETDGRGLWFDATGGDTGDIVIVAGFETGVPQFSDIYFDNPWA